MLLRLSLSLALVSFIGTGCAKNENKGSRTIQTFNLQKYPNQTSTIYGAWDLGSSFDKSDGISRDYTLYVNENSVGLKVICKSKVDGSVTVGAESKAEVTDFSVKILSTVERASHFSKPLNGRVAFIDCRAQITPKEFNYKVNGDSLAIPLADGTTANLQRKLN